MNGYQHVSCCCVTIKCDVTHCNRSTCDCHVTNNGLQWHETGCNILHAAIRAHQVSPRFIYTAICIANNNQLVHFMTVWGQPHCMYAMQHSQIEKWEMKIDWTCSHVEDRPSFKICTWWIDLELEIQCMYRWRKILTLKIKLQHLYTFSSRIKPWNVGALQH